MSDQFPPSGPGDVEEIPASEEEKVSLIQQLRARLASHEAEPAPAEEPKVVARPQVPQFGGAELKPPPANADDTGYVSARPLLMVGAAGAVVEEVAHALAAAGYGNKVATGDAAPVLDDELMRIVQAFQDDLGIAPHGPQGEAPPLIPGRDRHSGVIDALTWEALGLGLRLATRYQTAEHEATKIGTAPLEPATVAA